MICQHGLRTAVRFNEGSDIDKVLVLVRMEPQEIKKDRSPLWESAFSYV